MAVIVFALMFKFEDVSNRLLKINFYISLIFLAWQLSERNFVFIKSAAKLSLIPIVFLTLNYLATGEFRFKNYARNILYAYGLLISLMILAEFKIPQIKNITKKLSAFILFVYVIVQIITIYFQIGPYQGIYGTTSNPHFLALYSAIGFCVALYYFFSSSAQYRYIYLLISIPLSAIILYTSSRPVWIGLLISLFFIFTYFNKQNWIKFIVIFIAIQALLVSFNIFNYSSRFKELAQNITTEERVTIWQDTWQLQKTVAPKNWIVGNGLKSFYEDFKKVSRYHHIQDFRSPHNLILEMLYISGLIGLVLTLYMYYLLYQKLLSMRKNYTAYRDLSTLNLVILTILIVLNGLNFPFFSSTNIYPLTFILGFLYFIRKDLLTPLHTDH
ncbi:O-antigen ligase family protein [Methylotenera versatilis]|uniref:O-antigen ligase family protein n=1 Tax=Methylotenera versatilis TaxID=1055487 RepID=UPI0013640A7F|nr:O-antigen ligase family protein [Methylotenera versatilis]